VSASRSILKIASEKTKNTREKVDGSFVTDADFAAQGVIVQAIRTVSSEVKIVGEESEEEMAAHVGQHEFLDDDILAKTKSELRLRYTSKKGKNGVGGAEIPKDQLPLSSSFQITSEGGTAGPAGSADEEDCIVDPSRVTIVVDPLDGTKSYTRGENDCVSILIAIILDNKPCFGVIGKPFGYTGLSPMLDTGCVAIYGGPLINGVYVAGGEAVGPSKINRNGGNDNGVDSSSLPRAVISSSRSKGVVHDFCIHLGEKGLVAPEPLHISGAGEKSLRLILQKHNEALWFFPKPGTSLWDVAAPDALLRSLGGKMTDKHGNEMDYSKSREQAENVEGVVACIDADLHAECIRLFQQGDWSERH